MTATKKKRGQKHILTLAQIECGVKDPDIPFSLNCYWCDDGMHVESPEMALLFGWKEIMYDDGYTHNYVGWCPDCLAEGMNL